MLRWRDCGSYSPQNCSRPSWMVWKKRLPGDKVAVLLSNLSFRLVDGHVMDYELSVTMKAKHGLWMHVHSRNQ